MAINIFVLKGDLNGENRSGAFLFLSGIFYLSFVQMHVLLNRSSLVVVIFVGI